VPGVVVKERTENCMLWRLIFDLAAPFFSQGRTTV
jgi:hypothetical protein